MIYLIRHGEPSAGWGAHPDPGLNERGHAQAQLTADMLLEMGATEAITSPLQRCRDTAQAFETRLGVEARVEPRVGEIITPDGIEDRPAWLAGVMAGNWSDAGAAYTDWRRQAVAAIRGLPDGTAVFSHFVAINAIVSLLTEREEVVVFKPAHCSITRLERTGEYLRVGELGAEAAPDAM